MRKILEVPICMRKEGVYHSCWIFMVQKKINEQRGFLFLRYASRKVTKREGTRQIFMIITTTIILIIRYSLITRIQPGA